MLNYIWSKLRYHTLQGENNNGADQTVHRQADPCLCCLPVMKSGFLELRPI